MTIVNRVSFPRTSGGDSIYRAIIFPGISFSPHKRGCPTDNFSPHTRGFFFNGGGSRRPRPSRPWSIWYNGTMNNKHEDNDDSSTGGKTAARYMLASALVTLLMVMLSELSGSAAPVGALLLLLVVRSLFDL